MEDLQNISEQNEDWNKIKPLIKKIRFQVASRRTENASNDAADLASFLKAQKNKERVKPLLEVDECYLEVQNLVEKFIEIRMVETAMLLLQSLFALVKEFFEKGEKLDKLERIGYPIMDIAPQFVAQNKTEQFKEYYSFLNEILKEMQEINDVDLEFKCETVASFLHFFGNCCLSVSDYSSSIELYKQSVCLIKTVFGNNARAYLVFGLANNNLGVNYEETKQLEKAKFYYHEAFLTYRKVQSWKNSKQKVLFTSTNAQSLQRVKNLLKE